MQPPLRLPTGKIKIMPQKIELVHTDYTITATGYFWK